MSDDTTVDAHQGLREGPMPHMTTHTCTRCNCTSCTVTVHPNAAETERIVELNLIADKVNYEIETRYKQELVRLHEGMNAHNSKWINRMFSRYIIDEQVDRADLISRGKVVESISVTRRRLFSLPPTHCIVCPVCGNKHSFNAVEESE